MLMNAVKDNISVASVPNVLIVQDLSNAFAHLDMMVIRIMDSVQHHSVVALLTKNVERMKSAFNQANAFAHHHFSWTQATEIDVKIHVNDTLAESMQNVHRPIHHNVCAKLASKAIRCKDVSMKMNAQRMATHALMALNALTRKAVINASVQMECLAIHTKAAAF